jgi:L-amino acid N-acyltransferase YncA
MSSTTTITVRAATLRDAKSIAEIYNASLRDTLQTMAGDTPLPFLPNDKPQAYWREAIEYAEPQVQVAVEDDKIVGFVGYDRSRDKGTPNTMGEIWDIYVLSAQCGKGVGLALWDAAREGLLEEGCAQVSVWVQLGNERAIRFHELAGFKRELASARTAPFGNQKIEEIRLKRALN